jgi:hypothetical protein
MLNRTLGNDLAASHIATSDGNRYVVMYTRETQCEALRTLGRWASNPELSFTWCDAAIMANQIRNQFQGAT